VRRILSGNPLNIIKLLFVVAFAMSVAYLVLYSSIGERLLTPEGRKELVAMIDRLVLSAGWFGPALFVILFGTGVMALPGTPFIAAGALIFGSCLRSLFFPGDRQRVPGRKARRVGPKSRTARIPHRILSSHFLVSIYRFELCSRCYEDSFPGLLLGNIAWNLAQHRVFFPLFWRAERNSGQL
jgi:hypothetical protein